MRLEGRLSQTHLPLITIALLKVIMTHSWVMNQFSILQKWDESEQDKGDHAVSYVIKMFAY